MENKNNCYKCKMWLNSPYYPQDKDFCHECCQDENCKKIHEDYSD